MKISTDRLLGISAMLISLMTLVIFIYQTNLMREQSRLSVTPRLGFTISIDYEQSDSVAMYSILVKNKGLGPAIIRDAKIVHDQKNFDLEFDVFLEEEYPEINRYGALVQSMSLTDGSTLSAGETVSLFKYRVRVDKLAALMAYMGVEEDEDPFEVYLEYSSIYNEHWKVYSGTSNHPERI